MVPYMMLLCSLAMLSTAAVIGVQNDSSNATERVDVLAMEIVETERLIELQRNKVEALQKLRQQLLREKGLSLFADPLMDSTAEVVPDYLAIKAHLEIDGDVADFDFLSLRPANFGGGREAPSSLLVVGSKQGVLYVFDLSGTLLLSHQTQHEGPLTHISCSPHNDDLFVATVGLDLTLRLHNMTVHAIREKPTPGLPPPRGIIEVRMSVQSVTPLAVPKATPHGPLTMPDDSNTDSSQETVDSSELIRLNPTALVTFQTRGNKMIAIGDDQGGITVANRAGRLRRRTLTDRSYISHMQRSPQSLIYAGDRGVGFMSTGTLDVTGPFCEGTTNKIVAISADAFRGHMLYAGLENGEVLVFDTKAKLQNKVVCKLVSKLPPYQAAAAELGSIRGYVLSSNAEQMAVYNVTEEGAGRIVLKIPLTPTSVQNTSSTQAESIPSRTDRGRLVLSRNGLSTYVAVKSTHSNCVILIEPVFPFKVASSDFSNFKFPVLIVGILGVLGFQYYRHKQRNGSNGSKPSRLGNQTFDDEDESERFQRLDDIGRRLSSVTGKQNGLGDTFRSTARHRSNQDRISEVDSLREQMERLERLEKDTFRQFGHEADDGRGVHEDRKSR
eukprot:GILJ01004518.1.p1 GENE.GILJ01004518.1~~GILJ01004518.1.p1  ORF type:complete len:613 (-),score=110.44 GILJ01004518.1:212-2050(-)